MMMVLLRIKFKQSKWLATKINFSTQESTPSGSAEPWFLEMHESVRLAARLLPGRVACLPRSIVLSDMLRRRGHAANVVLGVNKAGGTLSSHAWVEVAGAMVGEPETVGAEFSRLKSSN